jgi:hypothetical protein
LRNYDFVAADCFQNVQLLEYFFLFHGYLLARLQSIRQTNAFSIENKKKTKTYYKLINNKIATSTPKKVHVQNTLKANKK